ncbi:MAG: helix-turn-helix transcriptional regulator [Cyclobacteriaceae bacterium]
MPRYRSGVFIIESKDIQECDNHITRLALNVNFSGPQTYWVGDREFVVKPGNFLLINEGQHFRTKLKSDKPNLTATFAFQVGLARRMMNATDVLSDETENQNPTEFIERTYPLPNKMAQLMKGLVAQGHDNLELLDSQLNTLLGMWLEMNETTRHEIMSIDKVKIATRREIYKRLHWANEYIHNHFHEDITVEQIAHQACLSSFHFKHLYKSYFKTTPYQRIIQLRLDEARILLSKKMKVSEVCRSIGWKDSSSFIRLFKKNFDITPLAFQLEQAS